VHMGYGGDTLNTAVYAKRSAPQLAVDFATALGDDALSMGLRERWAAQGIGLSLVETIPGATAGLYFIHTDPNGERRFSYWREMSAARRLFEASATAIESVVSSIDALYFSGITLAILPPAGRDRLLGIASAVRRRGALVAFDNNYRPRLWASSADARHAFDAALATSSCALLTSDDHMQVYGHGTPHEALAAAHRLGCTEVVIKRGADATIVSHDGKVVEVPTVPVARVVDTTAAGDSFAGAYIARRLAGISPATAAAAGNALAALVVQHHGAILDPSIAMPTAIHS
jgi:2-dehydro-3-deoxygluconokinase